VKTVSQAKWGNVGVGSTYVVLVKRSIIGMRGKRLEVDGLVCSSKMLKMKDEWVLFLFTFWVSSVLIVCGAPGLHQGEHDGFESRGVFGGSNLKG